MHVALLGDSLHIVLLAGTNDLSRRKTQSINLMDNLIESLDELKKFTNVQSIFACKLPPRSDISRVNQKVFEINQLLRFCVCHRHCSSRKKIIF